jgi:hypothetical protein
MPIFQYVKNTDDYDKITKMEFPREYTISEREVNRKKKAFSSLILL